MDGKQCMQVFLDGNSFKRNQYVYMILDLNLSNLITCCKHFSQCILFTGWGRDKEKPEHEREYL